MTLGAKNTMKDQYFGDINDYRKYGLLRSIIEETKLQMFVGWVLTPNDGSSDGKLISYLSNPNMWSKYDPALFDGLKILLSQNKERRVKLIEDTNLLPNTKYFSEYTPDSELGRNEWFAELCKKTKGKEFIFLDPDNGLEVKSKPYGRKGSSKYIYWREIDELWSSGKSLLIYQHFIREKRVQFIQRRMNELKALTPNSFVEAFSTPNVVFLMALQPNHLAYHKGIVQTVQKRWCGQIYHWAITGSK